jgi:two-component system, sensor histidine kinase and response regulator
LAKSLLKEGFMGTREQRALVVEDNLLNQELTRLVLEKEGYEVRVAEDGMEALGLLETFQPDLISMDLELPGINGTEIVRLIRSQSANNQIFIIALTGHGDDEWRQRALEAGCDGYLVKPISVATLRNAISLRPGKERSGDVKTPAAVEVDKEALVTRVGRDRELLRELRNIFREEWPRVNGALRQHLQARDSAALVDTAHALRGMLTTLSAIGAKHAAEALEMSAAAGDFSSAAGAWQNLQTLVDRFDKSFAEIVEAV